MATLAQSGKVTLLDIAQALDPQGRVSACAELLTQQNEILLDMPWVEGNLPTGMKASIRTGLPAPIWRSFYQGTPPTKSQRAQVIDTTAMLEDRSEVDEKEARLSGDVNAFRLSEAAAHIEGMNQKVAQAIFYGNAAGNPEQFNGFAPRYSTVNTSNSQLAYNVIDCGGTGSNNSSMWLAVWAPDKVTGIYPKGSMAGLEHQDLGIIDAFDVNNQRFRAYADLWRWDCGLHVKDWRYVVRACNINIANLVSQSGNADLITTMVRMLARVPTQNGGTPVFYANRTIKEMLSVQAMNKSQNALAVQTALKQFGDIGISIRELSFLGVPIRTCDQLLTTEARLT